MVCEHCGNILREGATVCDQCGTEITPRPTAGQGIAARRQGKTDKPRTEWVGSAMRPDELTDAAAPVAPVKRHPRSEGAGRPSARRGMPPPPTDGRQISRGRREKAKPVRRMMVNWALLWTVVLVILIVGAIGGFVFLKRTDAGQLILARMGRDANANALWAYGAELLEEGSVGRAIASFEKAYEQEPEREDIYDRLLQLADAYEAAGRYGDAEKTYTLLCTEIDKENPVAYRNIIRLMNNQDRPLELATFLQTAYDNTGDISFRRQREEMLPTTPTTDLQAGRLMRERDVALISAEDYDIYYIFGEEGELPEDGTLYETPLHLTEGPHLLRAVAVSSDLISDELKVQYTIELPSPSAPYPSLASGEYEKRQRIWLRYLVSDDEKRDDDARQLDITIHYTIDGQTPTSNSPIFDGEPFYLPGGRTTLKAVAVNGYGKVSNVLEKTYKITGVTPKKTFGEGDEFSEFTVMKTTRDEFIRKMGTPREEAEIQDDTVTGNCVRLDYNWGSAYFHMTETGYVLYAVETESTSMTGPRKTRIGMGETDVTGLFRDCGQANDQNGDRSLYYVKDSGYGKLYHLDDTHDRIDYVYRRTDNGVVTLRYEMEDKKVVKMSIRCGY